MTDTTNIPAGTWSIDPSHTDVTFSVRHLMISKVKGNFGGFTGTIEANEDLTKTTVTGTVDVTTVNTNDENRDNHLRSEDFFDIEKNPTMSFKSTKLESTKRDGIYNLDGELTIKGITKPVTFKLEFGGVADDLYGNKKAAASAETKISRSEFGLTWNPGLETGGVLVGDEVTILIDAQATLQK